MADPIYALKLELAVGSLTDITSYCQRLSYSRSIADAFTPLSTDEALFEMTNDVGSFSPLRNAGMILGRQVKLSATHGGSEYALYAGRVKRFASRPLLGERTTVIEALTDVDRLSKTRLDTGMLVAVNAGSLFTEIMTRCSLASYAAQALTDNVAFAWYKDRNAANALEQLVRSGYYQFFQDGAGTMQLKARFFPLLSTAVDTLVEEARDFNYTLSDLGVVNKAVLRAVPRQQSTDIATLAYLAQPVTIPASGHVGFFVTFVDPRDSFTETPVGSIVAQVASTDYYAAANSDGTGTNFTSALSLNTAIFGSAMVTSIFNANSADVYLSRFQVRGYPILAGTELVVKQDDSSSQTVFGLREASFDDNLIADYAYLRDLSSTIIGDRKEPRDQFQVTRANEFPAMLSYDVGALLASVNAQTGVPSVWAIRRMSHDVSLARGLEHTGRYELDRATPRPWLILDHPTYGLLDSGRQLAL